jgi:hypothetical protein
MKNMLSANNLFKFITVLILFFLFFSCKKEDPCRSIEQGEFELVE